MADEMEKLYQERLQRYVTAMRNEKPDTVPIRPFVAEFTAKYAGYTCQEVTHDYEKAFAAARKCAADFDWDAVVGNMVYGWTGLTQGHRAEVLRGARASTCRPTPAFQYLEPPEDEAWMRPDEYDAADRRPHRLPVQRLAAAGLRRRRRRRASRPRSATTCRSSRAAWPCCSYFMRLRHARRSCCGRESGTVSAISGILKAPFDIIADKLRGYRGPVHGHVPPAGQGAGRLRGPGAAPAARGALAGPTRRRTCRSGCGCTAAACRSSRRSSSRSSTGPRSSRSSRSSGPSGHQTLFYAEGEWNPNLKYIAQLPDRSIVYHVDRGDIFEVHRAVGHKFCLSGGIPNDLLAFGTPDDVAGLLQEGDRRRGPRRRLHHGRQRHHAGRNEGREPAGHDRFHAGIRSVLKMNEQQPTNRPPGVCIPWEEKLGELPKLQGDEQLVQRVWEDVDSLAYTYIWQCLLSF